MRRLRFHFLHVFTALIVAATLSACKPAEEAQPATAPAKAAPAVAPKKAAAQPAPASAADKPAAQTPAATSDSATPAVPPPAGLKAEPSDSGTPKKLDLSNLTEEVKKNIGIKDNN